MSTTPSNVTKARSTRRAVIVAVVVTVAAIALVLVGRALLKSHHEESRHYGSAGDIPARNGLFVLPPWAPKDATDITINVQTQGKGRSIEMTSSSGTPSGCVESARPERDPVPALDVPSGPASEAGQRCQEWFVVRDGATLVAWDAYAPRD